MKKIITIWGKYTLNVGHLCCLHGKTTWCHLNCFTTGINSGCPVLNEGDRNET